MIKMWKNIYLCLLVSCYCLSVPQEDFQNSTIQSVSVFYEALCPDSIKFIVGQVFPNYKIFEEEFSWNLIPFGNAKATKRNGKWNFVCQHGPKECFANKFHSCAIDLGTVETSLKFIYCSMDSDDPSSYSNLQQCSQYAGISWNILNTCYTSGKADILLAENGNKTAAVRPRISWIPTVLFNNYYNSTIESRALESLKTVLCELLDDKPNSCKPDTNDDINVIML